MRILRVLQSQSLSCGCFVGVYETYGGPAVTIVEETGRECRDHQQGDEIPSGPWTRPSELGRDAGEQRS